MGGGGGGAEKKRGRGKDEKGEKRSTVVELQKDRSKPVVYKRLVSCFFTRISINLKNVKVKPLSKPHQLCTDDTQLQKSAPLSEVTNLTKELNACTDDIKAWMTENQLKLNDDKTEALLFPFLSSLTPSTVPLPGSITLGSHNIPISDSARNLRFILDSKLSMKKHVIKICQTAYFKLKCISSICRFLTEDTTKTLATSYILSQLDYCNCLLMGTHLILSSNLSRKFRTLLQDLFSWHPVTTTQHLSWKICTGFSFQNVLSRFYVFRCYKWF